MMKISIKDSRTTIVRKRLSRFITNLMILTLLIVVDLLLLVLWPIRVLNKGLKQMDNDLLMRLD